MRLVVFYFVLFSGISGCVVVERERVVDRAPSRFVLLSSRAIDLEPALVRGRAGEQYRSGEALRSKAFVPLEVFLWTP